MTSAMGLRFTPRSRRSFLLSTVLLVVVGLTACGNGVADDPAARVGSAPISTSTVAHWMSVIAGEVSTTPGDPEPPVPDPPRYGRCIAYRHAHPTTFSTKSVTTAALVRECEQEYEKEKLKALYWVIPYEWVTGEATELGVDTNEAEVRQAMAQFDSPGPSAAALRRTLIGTRGSSADLLSRVKLILLLKLIQNRLEGEPNAQRATTAQRQQMLEQFGQRFFTRWKGRTVCRTAYSVPLCKNYGGAPLPFGLVAPSVPLTNLTAQ